MVFAVVIDMVHVDFLMYSGKIEFYTLRIKYAFRYYCDLADKL